MSHFKGNCPVCHKPFAKGDDVVICPECGAPYHRACFEEQGQCVFTSQHGNGFEYKPEGSTEEDSSTRQGASGMLCPSCHTVNDASNIFCEKCGSPLHGKAPNNAYKSGQNPGGPGGFNPSSFGGGFGGGFAPFAMPNLAGEIEGVPKKDWAAYIGPSAPMYLMRMTQMKQRGGKMSFMLSAFFLGPFYFLYRKMWGWAAATGIVTLILLIPEVLTMLVYAANPLVAGLTFSKLDQLQTASNIAMLVFNSLCGLFALYLYQKNGAKKINRLREQADGGPIAPEKLAKAGGVSTIGVLVGLVILIVSTYFLANYIGPAGLNAYINNYFNRT